MTRRSYPSDVDDYTYLFLLPYLLLSPLEASQRKYAFREVLNALLWVARTGVQWAYLPHDFPPAETVRLLAHRWFEAGCFENAAHDLRLLCRIEKTRNGEPSAIIIDSRTLQSTPESGSCAGYDGAKKRKGTKVHLAVDTLGHLLYECAGLEPCTLVQASVRAELATPPPGKPPSSRWSDGALVSNFGSSV